ncbi:GNAT family N-acetyltransferase [Devosia sp. D6-9]|nr:GNAT family N-acetyltransferase [Devosia sp. D6-9]
MLQIVHLDHANLAAAAAIDASFEVSEELSVAADEAGIRLFPKAVTPYRKAYHEAGEDLRDAIGSLDQVGFVALLDGAVAGVVIVALDWTGLGLIDCFAVDPAVRRSGVGAALIDAAKTWARAQGLPGVRLETQSNNVAACRFYERQGFVLKGFDADLYRGEMPGTREIALFWYFWF